MPVARQSPALVLPGARLLLACTLAGLPLLAQALDLGTQGTTYEIIEPDIRQTLVEAAAAADVKKFNDEREASARKFASTRPSFGLVPAGKTETLWIDPSITVQEDIQAPVKQADGSWKWQVIYPKGFRQNPLSVNRPLTAMVFFDPADPEQMALVAQLLRLDNKQFVPISVGTGDLNEPQALAEELDMHARSFGGVSSSRTLGGILMRMKNLPYGQEDDLSAAPGTIKP